MGSALHGVIGLCLSFVVISIVFRTSTSMSMSGPSDFAENNIHRRCMPNGTNSDCAVVDAGEEYLSEDEQIKFVVRPNMPREISYRALQRPPVCNAEIYGNCIVHVSPYYRPCNYYTRCIRHRGQFWSVELSRWSTILTIAIVYVSPCPISSFLICTRHSVLGLFLLNS